MFSQFVSTTFKRGLGTLAVVASVMAFGAVPSDAATILNVTTAGSSATGAADIGGSFSVYQAHVQPAGSGVIDSFLRLQTPNGQVTQERGFNTDAGPQPPLDAKPGNFTRSLQLSAVPVVTIGGTQYREFGLDVNQEANGNISLNQVQLFQSAAGLGTNFSLQEASAGNDAVISFPGLNPVFQLNSSSGHALEIQANSGSGSGTGDMFLYVQNSLFANDPNSYVTLFSQFGTPPGALAANDGFEEWFVREGVPGPGPNPEPVPEPMSLAIWSLLSLGFAGVGYARRNRVTA